MTTAHRTAESVQSTLCPCGCAALPAKPQPAGYFGGADPEPSVVNSRRLRETLDRSREAARTGKTLLRGYKYPPDRQEEAPDTVLRQAETISAEWALA